MAHCICATHFIAMTGPTLPRLVFDTNVVLDMLHFTEPSAQFLLAAVQAKTCECFYQDKTFAELQRVLNYPRLRITVDKQQAISCAYQEIATAIDANDPTLPALPPLPRCRDRDDQMFLQLAALARADVLVSKDNDLLRLAKRKTLVFRILTPSAAATWLKHAAVKAK